MGSCASHLRNRQSVRGQSSANIKDNKLVDSTPQPAANGEAQPVCKLGTPAPTESDVQVTPQKTPVPETDSKQPVNGNVEVCAVQKPQTPPVVEKQADEKQADEKQADEKHAATAQTPTKVVEENTLSEPKPTSPADEPAQAALKVSESPVPPTDQEDPIVALASEESKPSPVIVAKSTEEPKIDAEKPEEPKISATSEEEPKFTKASEDLKPTDTPNEEAKIVPETPDEPKIVTNAEEPLNLSRESASDAAHAGDSSEHEADMKLAVDAVETERKDAPQESQASSPPEFQCNLVDDTVQASPLKKVEPLVCVEDDSKTTATIDDSESPSCQLANGAACALDSAQCPSGALIEPVEIDGKCGAFDEPDHSQPRVDSMGDSDKQNHQEKLELLVPVEEEPKITALKSNEPEGSTCQLANGAVHDHGLSGHKLDRLINPAEQENNNIVIDKQPIIETSNELVES